MKPRTHTLVWLQGPGGPRPEIWSPEYYDLYRKRSEPMILSVRELADAERLETLEALARKYPAPDQ
ncbi:hypothetical protein ACVWZV_005642 [Bradyrhizobium sp. GM5.1]